MRRILAVFVWLLLIALQVTLWPQITTSAQPALTLAAALAVGLAPAAAITGPDRARVGSSSALWLGFWLAVGSGAVLDLYAQHHFGLLMIASALGYAAIRLVIRPPLDDLGWGNRLAAVLLAASVYEVVIVLTLKLTVPNFPLLEALVAMATLNVLATVLTFALFAGLLGTFRRRFGLG